MQKPLKKSGFPDEYNGPAVFLPNPPPSLAIHCFLAAAALMSVASTAAFGQEQFDEKAFESYKIQISDPDRDKSLIAAHKLIEALDLKNGNEAMGKRVRAFIESVLNANPKSKPTILSLLKATGIRNFRLFNPEILNLIYDADSDIRQVALDTLSRTRDDRTSSALAAKFMDEKVPAAERMDAIRAVAFLEIWQVGNLIEVLKCKDRSVAEAASAALAGLTCHKWGDDYESWKAWWDANKEKPVDRILREANAVKDEKNYQRAMKLINPRNLEQNLYALKEYRDERILNFVLDNLDAICDRKASDALIEAFAMNRTSAVRGRMLDVLGKILGREDLAGGKLLLSVLGSQSEPETVKTAAIRATGRIREVNSLDFLPVLVGLLSDENPRIRSQCAESIGKLGRNDKTAVDGLRGLLSDGNDEVRLASARALGEIKAESAVADLTARLGDADPNMRWCAASSLGLIGSAAAGIPLAARLSEEKEPRVLEVILAALVQLKSKDAIAPLAEFVKRDPSTTQAAAALDAILKISSQSAADLKAAAQTLLRLGLRDQAAAVYEKIAKDHAKSADEAREALADVLAESGKAQQAFEQYADLVQRGAGSKDVLQKLLALIAGVATQNPGEAVKLHLRLCARVKNGELPRCLTPAVDLVAVEKDPGRKSEIQKAASAALKELPQPDKQRVLQSAARMIDPAAKEAGLRAHQFLMALFPEPQAPALNADSPAADWAAARDAWLQRLKTAE